MPWRSVTASRRLQTVQFPSRRAYKTRGEVPADVLECDGGASFVVANGHNVNTLSNVTAAPRVVVPFGSTGSEGGQFLTPATLAAGPVKVGDTGVELVVMEHSNSRFQVFRA